MDELPNLAGIATKDLVETKGGGSFSASYINWARTLNLLHQHAPGWHVEAVAAPDGGIVFHTSKGGYLMMRLVHMDGRKTPAVPQAIMDNRNNAIASNNISARDVTDTHRRGACLVAAMHFGLAYELWAKDELESGFAGEQIGSDVPHVTKSERIAVDLKKSPAKNAASPDPNRPVGDAAKAVASIKKSSSLERAIAMHDSLCERFKFTKKARSEMQKAVKEKEGK